MHIKRSSLSAKVLVRALQLALAAPLFAVALGAGCAVAPAPEPVEQGDEASDGDGASEAEQVAEVGEALVSCPERTDCYEACDSQDLIWRGNCLDDGSCLCRPPIVGGGGGNPGSGSPHFWYCWRAGDSWECFELN